MLEKYEVFQKNMRKVKLPSSWGSPDSNLERIEKGIEKKMKEVSHSESEDLGFWYFNSHDVDHIKRVIGFLYELMNNKKFLIEDHEQYILYLAAYGHDLGMTDWDLPLKEAYEKVLKKKINTQESRKLHGPAGADILDEILAPFITERSVRHVIEEIASYHSGNVDKKEDYFIDGKRIRRNLLIALLRIADLMDADEKRLPGKEIIGKCIALASTCPNPIRSQFEHYMRRNIVLSCKWDNKGIELQLQREFQNFDITSPVFSKGEAVTVSGKEAFLGLLKEFTKEFGLPQKFEELTERYQDLDWNQLITMSNKGISNKLLSKGQKISWRVRFIGNPERVTPVIARWTQKAEGYRQRFDENPHPIEQICKKTSKSELPCIAGRKKEIELFSKQLNNPNIKVEMFWIYGPPGIGKTELKDEFCCIAEAERFQKKKGVLGKWGINTVLQEMFGITQGVSHLSKPEKPENIEEYITLTGVINKLSMDDTDTIIAIDINEDFNDYEDLRRYIKYLVDEMQGLKNRTFLIIATQKEPFPQLPTNSKIKLEGLSSEEIKELIEIKGLDKRLLDYVELLQRLTDGNPGKIIVRCKSIDTQAHLQGEKLSNLIEDIYKDWFRKLSPEEQKTLIISSIVTEATGSSP
ncbi:MAG: HD domain-containing protein [bacterium]